MRLLMLALAMNLTFSLAAMTRASGEATDSDDQASETEGEFPSNWFEQISEDDDSSCWLGQLDPPKPLSEQLEKLGLLYENEDATVMQELWFLGRYHGQYHAADGNTGDNEGWEDRRFRIGSQARFFQKLTLHAQMVSGSDFEPFYNGFTELWAQWAFADNLLLTVGQQKHRFTHDRNVSSRYLNTLERSLLVNNFALDYTPAITLSGKADKTWYYTGLFSNATGTDVWEAFTNLDSRYSFLTSVTFDLEESLGSGSAELNLGYLHSESNANATNLNRFDDGFSAALILTEGAGSLVSEATLGLADARGDAYGINIQPGYFLTDHLQLVTRYQLAGSDEPGGLVPQRRYEARAGFEPGDFYQSGYGGLNCYIAGHRLKLMNGLEYSDLNGQSLWTASFAVRMFWGPESSGPFPLGQLLTSD
jgi:hypothetical protein